MADEETTTRDEASLAPQRDPFEGVPPGCSPPKPMWPLWLALLGFLVWLGILVALMIVRFRTSVV